MAGARSAYHLGRRQDRRRAFVRALVIMAVALGLILLLPRMTRVSARAAAEPVTVTVTVRPGDTLWGIAEQHYTGRDVRKAVWAIRQANKLDSAALQPGMVLVIPAAG